MSTHLRSSRYALAVATALAACFFAARVPAAAQSVSEAIQRCNDDDLDADARVTACTTVLDSKRALKDAPFLALRAGAYMEKNAYGMALADLEAAAKLDAAYAGAITAPVLVMAGRIASAVAWMKETGDFDDLMLLRIDRRFAALWNEPEARELLQPDTIASRDLARARNRYEAKPDDLDRRANLVRALIINDRYDEVVDLVRALPQATLRPPQDDLHTWLTNALADALMARGDYDDANEVMEPLSRLPPERNAHLAGSVLHYGEMLFQQGRYGEALDIVAKPGPTSEYGESLRRRIRVCAASRLGRTDEADKALAGFEDREEEWLPTFETLICLGRQDAAGEVLTKLLRSQKQPFRVLLMLQDCRENPHWTAEQKTFRAAVLAVRDRPEVRRRIDEIGTIIALPIMC